MVCREYEVILFISIYKISKYFAGDGTSLHSEASCFLLPGPAIRASSAIHGRSSSLIARRTSRVQVPYLNAALMLDLILSVCSLS